MLIKQRLIRTVIAVIVLGFASRDKRISARCCGTPGLCLGRTLIC
jgi:hypothetical protein